jgi:hypothetical protein
VNDVGLHWQPTNFIRGIWPPPKKEGSCTSIGNWSAYSHANLNYLDGHHRGYWVAGLLLQCILTHDKNISRLVLQSPRPKGQKSNQILQFKRLLKKVLSKYKSKRIYIYIHINCRDSMSHEVERGYLWYLLIFWQAVFCIRASLEWGLYSTKSHQKHERGTWSVWRSWIV